MASIELPTVGAFIPPGGLTIGAVADLTGLSVDTLRYYEREGLLLDPARRDPGGRRRYGRYDLEWIAGLIMLRETGMSIADVRQMAVLSRIPGTESDRLSVLEAHLQGVLIDLDRTRAHLAALEKKIAAYRDAIDLPNRPAHEPKDVSS